MYLTWCLAGGEIGARCDFGGKVLPLFFPLSGCCCSLVARLPRLSRCCCCSRALSVCASSRTLLSLLSFASRTPPTLLSLFLLFVVVSLSLLLRLSRWFGSITHRNDRGSECASCLSSALPLFSSSPLTHAHICRCRPSPCHAILSPG